VLRLFFAEANDFGHESDAAWAHRSAPTFPFRDVASVNAEAARQLGICAAVLYCGCQ
jgi:hypothetical protein